jgi:Helix-turn-helix domain
VSPSSESPINARTPKIAVGIEEAAAMVSMHPNSIRHAIYAREIPVVQHASNKPYYIAVADLIAWFNGKKRTL